MLIQIFEELKSQENNLRLNPTQSEAPKIEDKVNRLMLEKCMNIVIYF